jgi:hypothetical protein
LLLNLIEIHGTDFSLIALRMHKTRDQIKRKYTILEKTHNERLIRMFEKKGTEDIQGL